MGRPWTSGFCVSTWLSHRCQPAWHLAHPHPTPTDPISRTDGETEEHDPTQSGGGAGKCRSPGSVHTQPAGRLLGARLARAFSAVVVQPWDFPGADLAETCVLTGQLCVGSGLLYSKSGRLTTAAGISLCVSAPTLRCAWRRALRAGAPGLPAGILILLCLCLSSSILSGDCRLSDPQTWPGWVLTRPLPT